MRSLITALLLTVSSTALAADFDLMLDSIDVVPSAAEMTAAWPDAQDMLAAVASNPSESQWRRIRAVSLLSMFPDTHTRQTLVTLGGDADPQVRRIAVYTAARTYGSPGDAELVAFVEAALADEDVDVQQHAVRSLRWIDHPTAAASLERASAVEDLRGLALRTLDRRSARLTEAAGR